MGIEILEKTMWIHLSKFICEYILNKIYIFLGSSLYYDFMCKIFNF